jgi:hypothetical protein
MSRLLMTAAATVLLGASGIALAQQDAVNPAPNYAAVPAVKNQQVKHIEDGVNSAPRYPTVAPVRNSSVTPIQDGNNPAPIVRSASASQVPQARRAKAPTKTLHARQHGRAASRG